MISKWVRETLHFFMLTIFFSLSEYFNSSVDINLRIDFRIPWMKAPSIMKMIARAWTNLMRSKVAQQTEIAISQFSVKSRSGSIHRMVWPNTAITWPFSCALRRNNFWPILPASRIFPMPPESSLKITWHQWSLWRWSDEKRLWAYHTITILEIMFIDY